MRRRADRRRDRQEEEVVANSPRRLSWFLLGLVTGILVSFAMVLTITGVGSTLMALTMGVKKPAEHIVAPVATTVATAEVKHSTHQASPIVHHAPAPSAPREPVHSIQMTPAKPVVKAAAVASKKVTAKPKYAFYQLLKDGQDKAQPATTAAVEPVKATPLPLGYYLKVASLRNEHEAEALKAKLMLDGYHATLREVKLHAVVWTRVMVGPYDTIKEASAVQSALQQEKLHPILLKSDQIT